MLSETLSLLSAAQPLLRALHFVHCAEKDLA